MHYYLERTKRTALLLLLLSFVLSACQSKPRYLIDDDTFAAILADMMVIEKLPVSKEERLKRANAVFEKYNVSPEDYAKTKLYHKRDVDFWQRIYQKTMKQLEKKAKEQQQQMHPPKNRPHPPEKKAPPARKSV